MHQRLSRVNDGGGAAATGPTGQRRRRRRGNDGGGANLKNGDGPVTEAAAAGSTTGQGRNPRVLLSKSKLFRSAQHGGAGDALVPSGRGDTGHTSDGMRDPRPSASGELVMSVGPRSPPYKWTQDRTSARSSRCRGGSKTPLTSPGRRWFAELGALSIGLSRCRTRSDEGLWAAVHRLAIQT